MNTAEFYTLTEESKVLANFYAKVEFIERKAWCSDQINYGITLTLKEDEHEYLLNQFN